MAAELDARQDPSPRVVLDRRDAHLEDRGELASGEELVEHRTGRRRRVTRERRDAIAALAPDADLATLVRAWLEPALQTLHGHTSGTASWQLLARSLQSASPLLAGLVAESQNDVKPLLDRLSALLPHLTPDEVAWRHGATLGLAGFIGSSGGAILCSPGNGLAAERFVGYVVAALNAPAVTTTPDRS